jgi:hypothetical protein
MLKLSAPQTEPTLLEVVVFSNFKRAHAQRQVISSGIGQNS